MPKSKNLKLFTVSEVASLLGKHPETVRVWIRNGSLPAVNIRGGVPEYRVLESVLAAWLEARTVEAR